MSIRNSAALLMSAATLAIVPVASAQAQDQASDDDLPHTHDPHEDVIVITAGGLQRLDFLAGTSLVAGEQLDRNQNGQIGEVLEGLPGVSASGFAPGASRPVLRGFDGERVRVLVDGIGSIDASNTSADHAVSIDPLTAEAIEVLRGPAVLLYGSSAIGGAVNVRDKRIPRHRPQGGFHAEGLVGMDTASDLFNAGGAIDVSLGNNLVWHVDGSYRRTDDIEIAGYALSDDLRSDLLADAAEEFEEGHDEEGEELLEAANVRGILPESASETYSLGSGLTLFSGRSSFGVSVSYYDTLYGVPLAPGAGHHHEEEDHDEDHEGEEGHDHGEESVSIDLEQFRADFRGDIYVGGGFLENITTRWGYSDYTHVELEGDEVGTTFAVEGVEGRVELIQSEQDLGGASLRGSIGGQYFYRDFAAIGAEAFVPPNTTQQVALFTLQELRTGPVEFELGGRWENTEQEAATLALKRSFDTFSGALGVSYTTDNGVRAGVNLSRTERAPASEELFADGPHIATSQYELGDPDLRIESAWGLEAYANASIGGAEMRVAVYQNWFDDFIYLAETGLEEDELPLFAFQQQGADWFGVEAEASVPLYNGDAGGLIADVSGSYIRATLDDGSPVPRIPPLNINAALEWQSDFVDLRGEVEWYDEQKRSSALEAPTDGYKYVNLSANFHPFADERIVVLLQAKNIFDVEGRRHASFTKDFVPLAGRNFSLTIRSLI